MRIRQHIPNIITCCNLLSGVVAIGFATHHELYMAYLFIIVGAVFDFFDGFSARLLGVANPIGKELDSLADVVTFGVAPSMMAYVSLSNGLGYWAMVALLMSAFSALRLAKFNLDERQTSSFIGLATPANAIFWAALSCFVESCMHPALWVYVAVLLLSLLSCYLLVSEIPFFSLKMKRLDFREYKLQGLLMLTAVLLLALWIVGYVLYRWWIPAGALLITIYVLINLLVALLKRA